ncbi:SDR family NAD(P)-dependent oxidoreductase [Microbacterium sp. 10M-3C3]|uniref:SDR family NAD(P)-dependent oxidoreductase n=1 Tax=Microbacterium sp. 10M-3C3 TaxID=2483401 RepID=UPI000F63BEB6|nr:SDR family NAD(P)-dependent oxidoreductase [Microbacterium sp. 10M-3C3]
MNALVLGANGRLGNAIAAALGQAGAHVVVAARDGAALDTLVMDLRAQDITADAVVTDVTDDESVGRAVAVAASGGLDVAVNNVGISHRPVPLGEMDLAEAGRVLHVTLGGVLAAMRFELAAMNAGGAIVNVASTAGVRGVRGMAAYAAAKHGVVGLTRSAAMDYAERGIRVNAVAPGPIDSGGLAQQSDETKRQVGRAVPLGRLGTAGEIAAAVAWLASPAASFITGTVVEADGGRGAS